MKEKGRNKEEKRNFDLILGSGRNEEEDFMVQGLGSWWRFREMWNNGG